MVQLSWSSLAALSTDRNVLPAFICHMARALRDVENARCQSKASPDDPGFSLRKQPRTEIRSVKVDAIEFMLMFVLFGSHKMYR